MLMQIALAFLRKLYFRKLSRKIILVISLDFNYNCYRVGILPKLFKFYLYLTIMSLEESEIDFYF